MHIARTNAAGSVIPGPFPVGRVAIKTDDRGWFRFHGLKPGYYLVGALATPAGARRDDAGARTDTAQLLYQPTFYPGIPVPDSRSVIALAAGEERNGIVVRLHLVEAASLEATVTAPSTLDPATLSVRLVARVPVPGMLSARSLSRTVSGRFVVCCMAPGAYWLVSSGRWSGTTDSAWDITAVQLSAGERGRNIAVTIQEPGSVSGTVEFFPALLDIDRLWILVELVPVADNELDLGTPLLAGKIAPDGTFTIPRVPPGEYRVRVSATKEFWNHARTTVQTTHPPDLETIQVSPAKVVKDVRLRVEWDPHVSLKQELRHVRSTPAHHRRGA